MAMRPGAVLAVGLLLGHALVATDAACGDPVRSLPAMPTEDGSIAAPPGLPVVTRATNSELVDLGHPGAAYGNARSQCPHWDRSLTKMESIAPWPSTGQNVTVPPGTRVLVSPCWMAPSVVLGTLTIPATSEVVFADGAIELNVESIVVQGALRAGSETCRLRSDISITLHGSRPGAAQPFGYKGIDVDGGSLDIHSVEYFQTWSRLAATASQGDTVLLLQDVVNWEAGQTIVVTTTQLKDARDWHQNEEAVITEVRRASHLGSQITAVTVASGLKYDHYGGPEYQAEVGLLSRRFKIQGSPSDSEPTDTTPLGCSGYGYGSYPCANHLTGYGGHIVVRGETAVARFSGVELFRMGQTNFEGRYPIHYHLVYDNGSASYVRDSSCHRSFYKCWTIHGTNSVTIERNVAYDVIGHALYLEDGVEEYNVIKFNLHAHVHPIGVPPGQGNQFLPSILDSPSISTAADATAAGFYMSNAKNYVDGNAVVGGYAGYQFPIFPEPLGANADARVVPRMKYTLSFDGNSCRSAGYWWAHATCLYVGGLFEQYDASRRRYFPGRTINGHRTCRIDGYVDCPAGTGCSPHAWCPRWERSDCPGGTWPTACHTSLKFTNFKASLTTVGAMHWGNRGIFETIEVHDIVGGPSLELFGDNAVDRLLVTCRTPNFPAQPPYCGSSMAAHEGDERAVSCTYHDKRAWEARTKVVTWYDTAMNTLFTDTKIRQCDPAAWAGCSNSACRSSALVEFTAHSDEHLPEVMSLTAGWDLEAATGSANEYLFEFNQRDPPSISGRFAGWLDTDGAACDKLGWGPTILGSNYDAGTWWRTEDATSPDCALAGRDDLMYCCKAKGGWLVSLRMIWSDALQSQLAGNGGSYCDNSFGSASTCPQVGWFAKFGDSSLSDDGVKLMQRAEPVGPVPGSTSPRGYGWYLRLDGGYSPTQLELANIQVHHDAIFVLAINYPKGTTFDIEMRATCTSSSNLCAHTFTEAATLATLRMHEDTYYVDDSRADVTTLFLRIVQRSNDKLADQGTAWVDGWEVPMFANSYLEGLPGRDWGIPLRSYDSYPHLTISATCGNGGNCGVYCCNSAPQWIPPLMWDEAAPTTAPVLAPTHAPSTTPSPIATPTPRPTPEPTLRPTPGPTEDVCLNNWQKCGNNHNLSERCCTAGYQCYRKDQWYSQCRPSCPSSDWECWSA